jgi:phenylpyruvate tautomerase PptA (4-oxalocrotonate tautomerase family)
MFMISLLTKLFCSCRSFRETPLPHLTVHALEDELDGRESALIIALTDAVVEVYGAWARDAVVVRLIGVPRHRWAVGGHADATIAPAVTFGMREEAFSRADAAELTRTLIASVTDAVTAVFGERVRAGVTVELVGTPGARTGVGGSPVG